MAQRKVSRPRRAIVAAATWLTGMSGTKMKYDKLLVKLSLVLVVATLATPVIVTTPAMAYVQYINIQPDHGPVGTKVHLFGESFTRSVLTDNVTSGNMTSNTVTFAKTYFPDKATLVQATSIDSWGYFETYFVVGEYPAGLYNVWVYDASASPPVWVSAKFRVEPRIELSESSGYVGGNITANGTGFAASSNTVIYFDDSKVATVVTDQNGSFTNAIITIPASASGSHSVKAVDASNNQGAWEFITRQQVTISPISGPIGQEVSISGTGFAAGEPITVTFDYDTVATSPASIKAGPTGNFTGKFYVPICATNPYVVQASDGSNNATATFTVVSGGNLNRIVGYIGNVITFSGAGFTPNRIVIIYYDAIRVTDATVDIDGTFSVEFKVPAGSSGEHVVSATDGTNRIESTFTVLHVAAGQINRVVGYVGSNVTFSGTGFIPDRIGVIYYDNIRVAEATIAANGGFSASFKVPVISSGEHTVSATDGTNTIESTFTVLQAATKINRVVGYVGSDVTLSGIGFIPDRIAAIYYDNTQVAEATVDANGNFSANFTVPVSSGGEYTILATDGINTTNSTFTMESIPPLTPVPLLPANGSTVEAETHFVWEGVTDSSGVTYTLQIASGASFTFDNSTSLVLTRSKLAATEYTLTPGEKLEPSKKGAYYWRVRAVDRASNTGGWSTVQEFYVSTSWSPWFVYSLLVEGGLFICFFGYWFVKKRT